MRFSTFATGVLCVAASAVSGAAVDIHKRQSTTQVFKFSSPTSAEGIAARSNGQLLVSFFDKAELWTVDPATKKGSKLVSFTDATCSGGITEIAPDVFAVVAGQYSFSSGLKTGSWAVWKVDFTKGDTPTATVLKKVPESGFFNGLTTLSNDTILIGDASKGAVWRMNVNTGEYSIAIQDTKLNPGSGGIPMGLDGLRYSNSTLWMTNVSKNTLYKVAVDATGKATGDFTTIWTNTFSDDLWVGPDGSAYVATGSAGKIQKVGPDGKVSTAASISSATAVVMGRTDADKNTLYIAASNGVVASVKV